MMRPRNLEREPVVTNEATVQDIPNDLRQLLETNREISHGDWNEGPKSLSVKRDNKTYKFYQDHLRDSSEWVVEVTNKEGGYEIIDIVESSDVEFLEKLFKQDISEGMRRALEESREVSYEEYGEKKVVRVKYGGKTYKFYRDDREYADWAMDLEDEKGEWLDTKDVREQSDVEYLEKLFETPTKEEQTEAMSDKLDG